METATRLNNWCGVFINGGKDLNKIGLRAEFAFLIISLVVLVLSVSSSRYNNMNRMRMNHFMTGIYIYMMRVKNLVLNTQKKGKTHGSASSQVETSLSGHKLENDDST